MQMELKVQVEVEVEVEVGDGVDEEARGAEVTIAETVMEKTDQREVP